MKPHHTSGSAQFHPTVSHLFRIFVQFPLSIHQSFPIASRRHYDKQLCKRLLGYAGSLAGRNTAVGRPSRLHIRPHEAGKVEPPEFIMLSGRSKQAGKITSGAQSG
jgi:hypothetical protein